MLETRVVRDLKSLCPAAYMLGETQSGSGVLCRVTGNLVTSGADPSSLEAFCCAPVANATGPGTDGSRVGIGYQNCVVWKTRRQQEFQEKIDWLEKAPGRVQQAYGQTELNFKA